MCLNESHLSDTHGGHLMYNKLPVCAIIQEARIVDPKTLLLRKKIMNKINLDFF